MSDPREFFRRQLGPSGFRVFRQVVPAENVRRAIEAICAFAGVDENDPATWYALPPENAGVVPLHHAQAFWDNRQHPDVYAAFREIYGHGRLWVTMDRAAFRPPVQPGQEVPRADGWHRSVGNLHWDANPTLAHPGFVQGVLLLSSTPAQAGGFQCVPGIYQDLDRWLAAHPGFEPEKPDISGYAIHHVTGEAGDLIVWDPFLPHGPATNRSSRPRIAQYLSMVPESAAPEERARRIALVRERRAPEWWRGLVGQQDPEPGPEVRLSTLGKKLVGMVSCAEFSTSSAS